VDPKILTNYLFGLLTIVLYAKDKFNTPTYDKESMGPFSQLPPQPRPSELPVAHDRLGR